MKILRSKTVASLRLPKESEQMPPNTISGAITQMTEALRERLNLFCRNATDTSAIDTVDVIAAISRSEKNAIAQICGNVMDANISGMVMKTSVVPDTPWS